MAQSLSFIPGKNCLVEHSDFTVAIESGSVAEFSAFRLDANGKVQNDEDFVFYNQPATQDHSVSLNYTPSSAAFDIDLNKLPTSICKIAFCVSSNSSSIRNLDSLVLTVSHHNTALYECRVPELNSHKEASLILGEFYRHQNHWKFRFVCQGFNDGFGTLAMHFGVDLSQDSKPENAQSQSLSQNSQNSRTDTNAKQSQSVQNAASSQVNAAGSQVNAARSQVSSSSQNTASRAQAKPAVKLKKVVLDKANPQVSLIKPAFNPAYFKVNLNWHQSSNSGKTPFWIFNSYDSAVDLDLGAYVKLKDGRQTIVQALGRHFGSLDEFPYVKLLGDDRTGAVDEGEWIHVNPNKLDQIEKIIIFAFIYEGVPNWDATDGIVKIQIDQMSEIETHLSEGNNALPMCAIAMITSHQSFLKIERIERYFESHVDMDAFFGWNFSWRPGSK